MNNYSIREVSQLNQFVITLLAFYNRFTSDELAAIDLASVGDTEKAAKVRSIMMIARSARYIDLSREDTQKGIHALASYGLLTQERVIEIITSPIQSVERLS